MGVVEQAERVLNENPGKAYCVKCLAEAASVKTADEYEAVSRLFHTSVAFTDRACGPGECGVCGAKTQIIRKP